MYRVTWLTCALLTVVAHARVLERCELAQELSELGVRPDHISTWVCIAYHESRFDTTANNLYSGDHGIFQISELYWCGPGKACGLPCSALRDDDISDDLDCALIVHEEHTRLQGDGFLAWVVYPQHCKHNTKKYLVDCDLNMKNSVPLPRSRGFNPYYVSYEQPNVTMERQSTERSLPPYLSVGNIVRENYGKVLEQHMDRFDWYNYKFDKIDELQLPVFNQPSQHINYQPPQYTNMPTYAPRSPTTRTLPAPRRTTTATTAYVPRIKVWRVIETNQFRKKPKFCGTTKQTTTTETYTQGTKASTPIQVPSTTTRPPSVATITSPPRQSTTPLWPTTQMPITTPTATWLVWDPPSATTSSPPTAVTTTTYKPFAWSITKKPSVSSSTGKPITSTTTYKAPTLTTTYKPFAWSTFKPFSAAITTRQWYSTTTQKPSTTTVVPKTYRPVTTTTLEPSTTTTTRKPTSAWTWKPWSSTTPKPLTSTSKAVTTKLPWYTFTSRTATSPGTTKQHFSQARTTKPVLFTKKAQNGTPEKTTQAVTSSTTTQKPRTTQSIFDLYLNPTKAPQLPSYKFTWGQSKLSIFAGGTTTPATTATNEGEWME